MIGLIAIAVTGGLFLLTCGVLIWMYQTRRRRGQSQQAAFARAVAAVVLLTLPITWDAIPTWVVFKYYAQKEAEFTVFKTPEQWKAENPGVAETLEPFRRAARSTVLGNGKSRTPLNDRFAYDVQSEDLFLSVGLTRHEIADTKTGEIVVRFVAVASGNSGGLVSGGAGWWQPWLVHRSSKGRDVDGFNRLRGQFETLGKKVMTESTR